MSLRARLLLSLFSVSSLALVACGGSESSGTTPDATPDTPGSDSGPDTAVGDAPLDSPVARTPKNHRPAEIVCAPSSSTGSSACASTGGGPPGACKKDSDCTAGTNGKCEIAAGGIFSCACVYDTCSKDSECSTGGPCACAGSPYQISANGCAPSGNCKVDADCGASGYCSPSGGAGCAGSIAGYYCHTTADECVDDADCKGTSGPTICTYDKTKKHWACTPVLACA
jgi:hypothetical protein